MAHERLAEDGVVAVNIGRTHADYSLVDTLAATMTGIPQHVHDRSTGRRKSAGQQPGGGRPPADHAGRLPRQPAGFGHPLLAEVARRAAPQVRPAAPPPGTPIFTDDRAPVEQVVHALVLRHLLGN